MNDYINKKAAYKVLTLYTASFVCLFTEVSQVNKYQLACL